MFRDGPSWPFVGPVWFQWTGAGSLSSISVLQILQWRDTGIPSVEWHARYWHPTFFWSGFNQLAIQRPGTWEGVSGLSWYLAGDHRQFYTIWARRPCAAWDMAESMWWSHLNSQLHQWLWYPQWGCQVKELYCPQRWRYWVLQTCHDWLCTSDGRKTIGGRDGAIMTGDSGKSIKMKKVRLEL